MLEYITLWMETEVNHRKRRRYWVDIDDAGYPVRISDRGEDTVVAFAPGDSFTVLWVRSLDDYEAIERAVARERGKESLLGAAGNR